MNTSALKSYAPEARKAFILAVTDRAATCGLTKAETLPVTVTGDVAMIDGHAFPRSVAEKRARLEQHIESLGRGGFGRVMEAAAYTWFNRLVAIRYMELHGYLDHGYRVLSHPEGKATPEIVEHAEHVKLPGLDRDEVIELKLDGTKEEGLFRLLLIAQCNALHQAMPFLFEEIGAADELLLPDNLLHSDSLVRTLVREIDEDLWQDIEIIGWLYQFYIAGEKKSGLMNTQKKAVESRDIPAKTQLFTPKWIVKYMVQNSLGAQWLATYPDSAIKSQMEYYIEPAEQTDEVNTQLAEITPTSLNPEELTLIDPASGSGHILVEAYDLFKAIYLERGYRQKDVAQLILEKNLFGLDIDVRAAQLTGFALMMKGRADDRTLFDRGVTLNVMALKDSTDFDAAGLAEGVKLADYGLEASNLQVLKALFEYATTFGSLIQVPEALAKKLPALKQLSEANSQDLFVAEELKRLGPLIKQAELLAAQYDIVVANPPYLSNKGMTNQIKEFLKTYYQDGQRDVFAAFAIRCFGLSSSTTSTVGLVTPFSWMYLSTFESLRTHLLNRCTIESLVELETNAFEPAMVTVCSFVLSTRTVAHYSGCYVRLSDFKGATNQAPRTLEAIRDRNCGWFFEALQDDFDMIPGIPIAYWLGDGLRSAFGKGVAFKQFASPQQGLSTADTNRFLRRWFEVSTSKIYTEAHNPTEAMESLARWFPHSKGGGFRRWFGNNDWLIDWESNGARLRGFEKAAIRNSDSYFTDGLSWSDVTSSRFNARRVRHGFTFDTAGPTAILINKNDTSGLHAFMNSRVFQELLNVSLQGLHYNNGTIGLMPVVLDFSECQQAEATESILVDTSETDWNAYERSWDFQSLPMLTFSSEPAPTLENSYAAWITQNRDTIAETKRLEEENNRLFIDAYGLADELVPDVPIEQITLTVNPSYRYGGKLTEEELWTRFRQDTMQELVSYAVGCMMGRYSLDEPGLVYAHSGNEGFDPGKYPTFPADDDGIVPLTDTGWFEDDAANRVVEFVSVAWDKAHLEANLAFLAENLSPKKNESSRDTIRRYLCDSFFKDHLQTYKKRPIYWLFSSGKQRAFQCLVYLHRYNEGTLARMRTQYAIPLQGKLAAQIDRLEDDIASATSTSQRTKLEKQHRTLKKQLEELRTFDEKLRHYADKRISLDLDDGVKVNYGKFGDLLASVKDVTGKKPEEE